MTLVRSSIPPTMRIGELAAKVGVSTMSFGRGKAATGSCARSDRPAASASTATRTSDAFEESIALPTGDQGVSAVEASAGCSRPTVPACPTSTTTLTTTPPPATAPPSPPAAGRWAGVPEPWARHPAWGSRAPVALRSDPPALVAQLLEAVSTLDEDRAHAVLDVAFGERSVDSAIIDVLLPLFVRVGELWELGRIGIAQEHFASSLVRRRLGAMSLTWGVGSGPVAVLACPPGGFTTSCC